MKSCRVLRADAARIWAAALREVDPETAIKKVMKRNGALLKIGARKINLDKFRKIWVIGAGKAAAPMGLAVESVLGRHLAGGVLATKHGHSLPLKKIEIIEAGHPIPDANSVVSANEVISLVKNEIQSDDFVLCLLSGGASSLLVSPVQGITLRDKMSCAKLLLNSGADIYEVNAVRKHLSAIKGGRLARLLAHAQSVVLALSDVVGDDLGTIASGPMAPDSTTFIECVEILRKYKLLDSVPASVKKRVMAGASGRIEETLKPGDPAFTKTESFIIAGNGQACSAAALAAKKFGYDAMILTSRLEGDNAAAAQFHMAIANEIAHLDSPLRRPACIISGGETTAAISGNGKGGRNQEFALHCARKLASIPVPCVVASIGTDGTDGPTDAAGAIADNSTLLRSCEISQDFLLKSLANNDSYTFFKQLDDLIVTGPTRTNVMDLHIVLIG